MAKRYEQAKLEEDPVSINISKMLSFSLKSADRPCISKVPNYLRHVCNEAYEPLIISIGPYHRGKAQLQAMEQQKIRFLQKLLEEKETHVSVYVKEMRDLKDKARKCYAADPPSDLDSDDFVEMLLLDGVFVVQMIRMHLDQEVPRCLNRTDMVRCYSGGLYIALRRDMLLLENQLPYFVLWKLFCMIESRAEADQEYKFEKAIFKMLRSAVPGKERPETDLQSFGSDFKHLLDFTYHCCCHPSTLEKEAREKNPRNDQSSFRLYIMHLPHCWYSCFRHPSTSDPKNNELKFIRCATELREAGIKFKLFEKGNTMFDIRFENGSLHIPKITIGDYTERFLRNLVAYEQMLRAQGDVNHATDYTIFMDCLINSPKDVEILCQEEIIVNDLGNDKAVARMINDLGAFIVYSDKFYYTEIFEKVNRHCSRRWNRRMANLKHNYFNSPWALISVLAAALLLLLTLMQTVFTVIF